MKKSDKKGLKGKNPYTSDGNFFDGKIREVPKGLKLKKGGEY